MQRNSQKSSNSKHIKLDAFALSYWGEMATLSLFFYNLQQQPPFARNDPGLLKDVAAID
jgi:hypothetical protein